MSRQGDDQFMVACKKLGLSNTRELDIIIKVHQHQGVLFKSDIFQVNGKTVERFTIKSDTPTRNGLPGFLTLKISSTQFWLWKHMLQQLAPGNIWNLKHLVVMQKMMNTPCKSLFGIESISKNPEPL
jgi:hypothetical protein